MAETNRGSNRPQDRNQTPIENWAEVRANVVKHFSQLTDDDLKLVDQNNSKLMDILHDRYGYNHNQAQQEWERFMQTYAAGMQPSKRNQGVDDDLINGESEGSATSQVNGPQHKDDLVGQPKHSR